MTYSRHESPDRILIFVIFFVGIDLITTGSITWSMWPAGIFLLFYFLSLERSKGQVSRDFTFTRERFAKGEISEEEFLREKDRFETEQSGADSSGFRYAAGIGLICIGGFLILRNLFHFHIPWLPFLLIVVGLFSIFRNIRG